MALPEHVQQRAVALLFALCDSHTSTNGEEYRLAFRIRMNAATIYKVYGPWNPKFPKSSRKPIAKVKYNPDTNLWTLYRAVEHDRWHTCEYAKPTADLLDLVITIEIDPAYEFFG